MEDLKSELGRPLIRNSAFLLLRSFLIAALGYGFWIVVAWTYATEDMGRAAALITVVLFLARAAALGLPHGILRFLPEVEDKPALLNGAFTLATLTSLGLGFGFLAGLELWAPGLIFVRGDPLLVATIVVAVLFFTLDGIVDNAFVAARRADYGLLRSTVFYGLRLPLVVALVFLGFLGILASYTLSLVVSVLSLAVLLPKFFDGYRPIPTLEGIQGKGMLGFSLWTYASGLVQGAGSALLPLIILNQLGGDLGARAAAHFYLAFAFATLLYAVPQAFSTSLLVEGSHTDTDFRRDIRSTVRFSAPLLTLGIAGAIFLGEPMLALIRPSFAAGAYAVLVLLALSSPVTLASGIFAADLKVAKRVKPIFAITVVATATTLSITFLTLPTWGILGAGAGVVAGQVVNLGLKFFASQKMEPGANGRSGEGEGTGSASG